MMIPDSLLGELLDHVACNPLRSEDQLAAAIRQRFPGIHITVCSDDDMPPRVPHAADNWRCRLYYVSSGEHCLGLTTDADAATGVAIGLIDPDH